MKNNVFVTNKSSTSSSRWLCKDDINVGIFIGRDFAKFPARSLHLEFIGTPLSSFIGSTIKKFKIPIMIQNTYIPSLSDSSVSEQEYCESSISSSGNKPSASKELVDLVPLCLVSSSFGELDKL